MFRQLATTVRARALADKANERTAFCVRNRPIAGIETARRSANVERLDASRDRCGQRRVRFFACSASPSSIGGRIVRAAEDVKAA